MSGKRKHFFSFVTFYGEENPGSLQQSAPWISLAKMGITCSSCRRASGGRFLALSAFTIAGSCAAKKVGAGSGSGGNHREVYEGTLSCTCHTSSAHVSGFCLLSSHPAITNPPHHPFTFSSSNFHPGTGSSPETKDTAWLSRYSPPTGGCLL